MIDKLEFRIENLGGCGYTAPHFQKGYPYEIITKPDTNYGDCRIIKKFIDGRQIDLMVIKTKPRKTNGSPVKISLNPNNYLNLSELLSTISFLGHEKNFIITRIDHAVDIPIPLKDVLKVTNVKYKRNGKDYFETDNSDGFDYSKKGDYLGAYPEVLVIYDKAYESLKKDRYKRRRGEPIGINSRLELRQSKNKPIVPTILELASLAHLDPFSRVISQELIPRPRKNKAARRKWDKLNEYIKHHGLYRASRILNKNRNFKRDFGQLLIPSKLKEEITSRYHRDLRQFIGD